MKVMADAPMRAIRESINVTREDIVRRSRSLSIGTVRNAEKGRSVKYDTALQILEAVNGLLQDAGREPVTLEDLGLKLF
jgi:transcriptional regulator with XRE-family HTH domain